MTSGNALSAFGQAVRKARTARAWTLEQLAHEALGNQERKSYVSAVENGRRRLSALTVQKFARALALPQAVVDAALGMAVTDEATELATGQTAEALMREVESLRRELKLSEALVIALAWEFAEGNPADRDTALRELRRALEVARDIAAQRARGTNLGDEVDAILKRLAALTAKGELDRASAEADRAIRDWEDRQAAMQVQGLALLDAGIEQDYLRRDAASVAAKLERRAALDRPAGGSLFEALRAVRNEWYERGRDKGLNLDLEVAIDLARRCGAIAADNDERGDALNNLGNALSVLGEREAGTARLEDAVIAYRAALEERTRERVPLQWAMTQNNLGTALWALGERESGTARLEEAVIAFRAALKEFARDRVPLDWATTQSNLGGALRTLGERETGTARFADAVSAFRAALNVWTRERVPLDWAMTQNNLGNALAALGERETGTARLDEAVAALDAALTVWTRERMPLDWASTQNNLGNALAALGRRETGTTRLEAAVAAYGEALKERTRERVPFLWARTRKNLSEAGLALFDRTGDTAHRDAALAAVDEALALYRESGAAYFVDKAERLRADILSRRG